MRHKFLMIFLILPIIVPMGLIIYHSMSQGQEWHLKVQGYDPRDLLRGRYIQFRYDFEGHTQEGAICLSGDYKKPEFKTVDDPDCKQHLTLRNWVLKKPQRFYIPEDLADRADKLVRGNTDDIRAGVVVRGDDIVLKNLYYKGENILDYLRNQHE